MLLAGLLLGSRVGAAGGYGSTTGSGQLLELAAPASALLLSASLWRYPGSLRFGLAAAGAATWAAGEILGAVDMVPNRTVGAVYPVLGAGITAWGLAALVYAGLSLFLQSWRPTSPPGYLVFARWPTAIGPVPPPPPGST